MTALNKQALREAAEKATPGRIGDRIDGSGSIKYECHGYDGSLVLRADHKDMEYGFIGDNGNADELFFRLCVPDVILALLDELEAAEKRIAELERYRTAFTVWHDKTEWVQSDKRFDVVRPLGKHRADVLREYIGHLEARQIALPQRLSPEGYHIDEAYMVDDAEGEYLDRDAVIEAISAAGIKVKES
ncbi:ead/Ea22-like family protein [Salmonella enterica subsp. enterica serovar Mishmarhaemek]|nr:ead/Ea22-like family protein [Salmonella enterica subsp. enterica serovar Mishmarhaemek]